MTDELDPKTRALVLETRSGDLRPSIELLREVPEEEVWLQGQRSEQIFAGPVLDAGDPDAYGIQYPVKFWKVVAAVVDGELSAYGFVLDQTPVVDEFGLEVLDFGKFTVHQRPLLEIERMTGVVLPDVLEAADVLLGNEAIDLGGGDELAHRARR